MNLFTISFHFLFITFSQVLKEKYYRYFLIRTGEPFKQNVHCGVLIFTIWSSTSDRRICQYSELDSHWGLLSLHILAIYPKYLLSIYLFSIMLLVLHASLLMSLSSQTLRQGKKTLFGLRRALHKTQHREADYGGNVRSLVNRSQPKVFGKFQFFFQPKFKFYRINFLLTDSV